MTMDYGSQQSRSDLRMPSPRIISTDSGDISIQSSKLDYTAKTNIKRSFDVAFLMLPDEKLKNKQSEKQPRLNSDAVVTYPSQISVKSDASLRESTINNEQRYFDLNNQSSKSNNNNNHHNELELINSNVNCEQIINNNDFRKVSRYINVDPVTIRSARIYDDPAIHIGGRKIFAADDMPKSAFTKVPHHVRQQVESPIPPSSPDQMSCPSSSPPVSASPPRHHVIYQNFRPEYRFVNGGQFHTISQLQAAQNQKFKQQFMYRPIQNQSNSSEMPSTNYIPTATFPFGTSGHPFSPQPDLTGIVRNPAAAALLTSLIPPTIATSFTLTAQNVCAKCNISFRMTSDLVYHMRSHHKSEFTNDTNRRKREEKLKCPVCNESFRERHHLTRHMTAHQDKASDEAETIQIQRRHK